MIPVEIRIAEVSVKQKTYWQLGFQINDREPVWISVKFASPEEALQWWARKMELKTK